MPTLTTSRRTSSAAVPIALVSALALTAASAANAVTDPVELSADAAAIELTELGTYRTGVINEGAAEIVSFHAGSDQLFVVNAQAGLVQVLDAADPATPTLVGELDATGTAASESTVAAGAVANSVAVRTDGLVAVALEAPTKTDLGWVAFFDAANLDGGALGAVQVGALPDMVTFSPDGAFVVVANEGEPADDFSLDPEGSVAVIAAPTTVSAPTQADVGIANFHAFEANGALPDGVRTFGPQVNTEFPVSANLEPEYITVDGTTAYVTVQEANAIAVIDLATATVTDLLPLGAKDHSLPGNELDPSNKDDAIAIANWPVLGFYMPDTIDSFQSGGSTYLITANEGDAREWGDYVEPARVKDLGDDGLAPICADSPAAALTADEALGRLNITTANGLSADGTCYEQLYSFGGRSFSIWNTAGDLVFDSGARLEQIVAEASPNFFNSNHTESGFESRSDDKGPEPEAVTIGEIDGVTYAFVGFERVGGIAVFDVTTPTAPTFVTYLNNRDFSISLEDSDDPEVVLDRAGDLGPEGLAFVSAADSPNGEPMLAVGNEISGTTSLFAVTSTVVEPTEPATTEQPTAEQPTSEQPTSEPTSTEPTNSSPGPVTEFAVTLTDNSLQPGDTVRATVAGAAPGEVLSATMYSDPVALGSVTADAQGNATLTFRVPADTTVGAHRLVIAGPQSGTTEVRFLVQSDGGSLASTGVTHLWVLLLVAVLAAAVGGLLLRRARARLR